MSNYILGTEPEFFPGGDDGVLVIHGFTGNPQSMRPIATKLAELNLTVDLPVLPGHATAIEQMIPTRYNDYLTAIDESFNDLNEKCGRVGLVGLSMGGTLACELAAKYPVTGVALINPFIDPPAPEYRNIVEELLKSGMEVAPGVGSDIKKPGSKELAYEGSPLEAALSLFEGLDNLYEKLQNIHTQILLFSSREDHVVPTSSGDILEEKLKGHIERVWLENSYHVATLDFDQELIESRIVEFFKSIFGIA